VTDTSWPVRFLRFLVGLLLLPVCAASLRAVYLLLRVAYPETGSAVPLPELALAAGFVLWLLVFFTLPAPTRSYILAHELTHALWGMLMGARVSRIEIKGQRGSVSLSRTNTLVLLAPYFFPLYTIIVVLLYYALGLVVDMQPYYLLWLGLIGFTWGFHLTFTIGTLMQYQTDIQSCGRLFSYALILLLNVLGICLWIVLMSPATLEQLWASLRQAHGEVGHILQAWGVQAWEKLAIHRSAQ